MGAQWANDTESKDSERKVRASRASERSIGSPVVTSKAREVGRHRCPRTAWWWRVAVEV